MELQNGQCVLLLWGEGQTPEQLQDYVSDLNKQVGNTGRIQVEHMDRLTVSNHSSSSFDVILSGHLPSSTAVHTAEILAECARVLKSNGKICICEPTSQTGRTADILISSLKLAGFIDAEKLEGNAESQRTKVSGKKPAYEVGASSQLKLSFAKKPKKVDTDAAKVWTLSATDMMDADVDLIDSDALLDEDDLKKPDPSSLRVCATTGKRKACKNCSCGLAEELSGEGGTTTTKKATSACGSCYLGDAFRCASCPYLGMPAFKPGEKVTIPNTS